MISPEISFFLSAQKGDLREFAMLSGPGGSSQGTVHAFESRRGVAGFRPRERLFALNEPTPYGAEFRTRLLHIETDKNAVPKPVTTTDIFYDLYIRKRDGAHSLVYRISDQSRETLDKTDFPRDYPPEFTRSAEGLDPALLEQRLISHEALSRLPFPPHHPSPLANTARHYASKGILPPPAKLGGDDWEAPARIDIGFLTVAAAPAKPDGAVETASGLILVSAMPADLPPPPGHDNAARRGTKFRPQ